MLALSLIPNVAAAATGLSPALTSPPTQCPPNVASVPGLFPASVCIAPAAIPAFRDEARASKGFGTSALPGVLANLGATLDGVGPGNGHRFVDNNLASLFDGNRHAGGVHGLVAGVDESPVSRSRRPVIGVRYLPDVVRPHIIGVPSPDISPAGSNGTLAPLVFSGSIRARLLMARDRSDDDYEVPEPKRNNPQRDEKVREGFKKNHDEYCEKHPSSRSCIEDSDDSKGGKTDDKKQGDSKAGEGTVCDALGLSTPCGGRAY